MLFVLREAVLPEGNIYRSGKSSSPAVINTYHSCALSFLREPGSEENDNYINIINYMLKCVYAYMYLSPFMLFDTNYNSKLRLLRPHVTEGK